MSDPHENHGHSIAAWTGVGFLLVAAVCIAVGVAWGLHSMQITGTVLAVVGVAAGVILSKAGFGAEKMPPPPNPAETGQEVEPQPESRAQTDARQTDERQTDEQQADERAPQHRAAEGEASTAQTSAN